MTDDRRAAPRHAAYIGAEIDTGEGAAKAAITHDGSATGLLLLTRADLEPGQTVKLAVFFDEGEARSMTGRVVRRDPLDLDENTLWRCKVAVELDQPEPDLDRAFTELADKQSAIYGTKAGR